MITFLTLYLGLIAGPRDFELSVADTTARVEVLLDGELETEITAPPDVAATRWRAEGPALRFHIGLEDTADLKADLDQGFARLTTTA